VQNLLTRSPHQAAELLKSLDLSVEQAATDLLEVVGGGPRLLAQAGLAAALRSAAGTSPLPVELVSSGLGRYSAEVELALYFCCMEALQNVAKHAAAHAVLVELHGDERSVTACVRDDGRGFEVPGWSEGGLGHMAERIEEVGGALSIRSDRRDGTTVRAEVPLAALGPAP
jgi:signal transduction histidine kinase